MRSDALTEAEDTMALQELRQEFEGRMTRMEDDIVSIKLGLTKLTETLDGYRGNQEQTLMMLQRIVNRHDEQLNGFQDKPGLVLTVDRLKNRTDSWTWHLRAIWAALLAGGVKGVIDYFTKG